jgi:hypothetical protein
METRTYAKDTYITVSMPWGVYHHARVLCADGVVRKTCRIAITSDTFFSIPASVKVRGKTGAGFVSFEDGVVVFTAYKNRKNCAAIVPR